LTAALPLPLRLLPTLALALAAVALHAEPMTPSDDRQVLERVSPRANSNPRARELQALRTALQREPRNPIHAVALARRYVADALAEGDPRYVGYAQAALAPWWREPSPPPAVRVQRAVVLQYEHRFDEALADLDAAVTAETGNAEAWAWKAAIHMVRADYANARRACAGFAPLTSALIGSACTAYVDSLTGRAADASRALDAALRTAPEASREERLWALTRLAEIDERRGDFAAAERSFQAALALGLPDVYLLAAHADFLLDRGRAGEAVALLAERGRADVLLLRLAIAGRAAKDPRAEGWTRELSARFDAARARGDSSHEKEESRFALALRGDAARALTLARANHDKQREPADARVLLEAALAARSKDAALPVLQWMETNQVESVALTALAERVRALP
jgi:Tfp pilus assembly protein PilF